MIPLLLAASALLVAILIAVYVYMQDDARVNKNISKKQAELQNALSKVKSNTVKRDELQDALDKYAPIFHDISGSKRGRSPKQGAVIASGPELGRGKFMVIAKVDAVVKSDSADGLELSLAIGDDPFSANSTKLRTVEGNKIVNDVIIGRVVEDPEDTMNIILMNRDFNGSVLITHGFIAVWPLSG